MKSIYTIFALFTALLLASCAKDEDKIYLKSADSNELLASTDAVVLTEATSKLYALSLAWTDQTLQISDPQYKPTTTVITSVQASLNEDFSGTVLESAVSGLSQSYTVSALNVLAYKLGATVDQSQPVYFRLTASTGSNLTPAYSNTVKVAVTPYFIDFHYANILLKPDMNDSEKDFYSPDADGKYSGFLGASSWMGIYVQEADGSVWHTAQDSNGDGVTFSITTEVSGAENGWDMWFPGIGGCYFVNVNTENKFWNALLLPELTLVGVEGVTAEYSRGDGQWKVYFTGTKDEELTLQISGTGKLYDQSTGTDDTQAKDVKFAFGGTAEKLTFATGDEAVPAEIKVTVPADGDCTLIIDLNNPEEWTVSVEAGGAEPQPEYNEVLYLTGISEGENSWDFTKFLRLYNETTLTYAGFAPVNSAWGYNVSFANDWSGMMGLDEGTAEAGSIIAKDATHTTNIPAPEAGSTGLAFFDFCMSALTYNTLPVNSVSYTGFNDDWNITPLAATSTEGVFTAEVTITATTSYGAQILINDNWEYKFGGTDGVLKRLGGEAGNIEFTETSGTYTLTVDLINSTYTIIPTSL